MYRCKCVRVFITMCVHDCMHACLCACVCMCTLFSMYMFTLNKQLLQMEILKALFSPPPNLKIQICLCLTLIILYTAKFLILIVFCFVLKMYFSLPQLFVFLFDLLSIAVFVIRDRFVKKTHTKTDLCLISLICLKYYLISQITQKQEY